MIEKEIRTWKKVLESDLSYIAFELKESIETPALILLEGQLGAGKTTFAKTFIDNKDEETMSPTYSILYEVGDVLHADLYRIKDKEEIIQLELSLYLEDKKFFLAEWGKKFFHTLNREIPEDFHIYNLEISVNDGDTLESKSRNFTLFELKEY